MYFQHIVMMVMRVLVLNRLASKGEPTKSKIIAAFHEVNAKVWLKRRLYITALTLYIAYDLTLGSSFLFVMPLRELTEKGNSVTINWTLSVILHVS